MRKKKSRRNWPSSQSFSRSWFVAEISRDQLREIAQTKMKDLNAVDIEGAMRQIEGTDKQMGIKIKD